MSQRPHPKYFGDRGWTRPDASNHFLGWHWTWRRSKKLKRSFGRQMRQHWPLSKNPKAGPYSKRDSA